MYRLIQILSLRFSTIPLELVDLSMVKTRSLIAQDTADLTQTRILGRFVRGYTIALSTDYTVVVEVLALFTLNSLHARDTMFPEHT